jgi:DmsE family decaheme c-type cytochrome
MRGSVFSIAGAILLALACAQLEWIPIGPRRVEPIADAIRVGASECSVCHDEVQGHSSMPPYHADCESCHGGGDIHSETEEISDIRFPASSDCLGCHAVGFSTHLDWVGGDHDDAGLICSDCHNPHERTPRNLRQLPSAARIRDADAASNLCVQCHEDVWAQFEMPSHHPVGEGALSCLSCHDPHSDGRLVSNVETDRCTTCHRDIRGPWTFEHPPVVEGCMTCHDPHGAVAQSLVATAQPAICMSCHPLNDLWHHDIPGTGIITNRTISSDFPQTPGEVVTEQEASTFLRRCTDCHGAVHGSYTDEHLRH